MALKIDLTQSYMLQAIVEANKPEAFFFLDRYCDTTKTFKTNKVLVEYKRADTRKKARFVPVDGKAIPVERRGYEMAEYSPACIKLSRSLTIDDLATRGFGEPLISGSTPAERAVKLIAEDVSVMDTRIRRQEEWMVSQLMQNNGLVMQEYVDAETEGNVNEIRYYDGAASEHKYTIADTNKWNSAGADVIGDVHAMCKLLSYRGINAVDLVVGSDVADVFYKNEEISRLLDKNLAINFGSIDERITAPGVSWLGQPNFRGFRLNIIVVDTTYENDNGVDTPYFPKDAAMVTVPHCLQMSYGAVSLMPYGSIDVQTLAKKRVMKLFVDNEHDTRRLEMYSRPLAMPKVYTPFIFAPKVVG